MQAPRVRDARSGSLGPARLCRAESRFARRRKIAGQARHQRAGRVPRFLRRDLVGGRAALVQRQDRAVGDFLLRRRAMGDRGAAPALSRGAACRGRARTISSATGRGATASSRPGSSIAGGTAPCCGASTAMPRAPISTSSPASAAPAPRAFRPPSSRRTARTISRMCWRTRSSTTGTRSAAPILRGSSCRRSRSRTGAGSRSICAAPSPDGSEYPRARNGSRCSRGPISSPSSCPRRWRCSAASSTAI